VLKKKPTASGNPAYSTSICLLNQAAERLSLPLHVVQRTFHDDLLKGYWKVADG